jgi:hypothetical protein
MRDPQFKFDCRLANDLLEKFKAKNGDFSLPYCFMMCAVKAAEKALEDAKIKNKESKNWPDDDHLRTLADEYLKKSDDLHFKAYPMVNGFNAMVKEWENLSHAVIHGFGCTCKNPFEGKFAC